MRNSKSGLKEFELPIDVPSNPFSVKLIENELYGQRATYESKYVNDRKNGGFIGPTWNFQVHSGKLEGVKYTLEELTDR